MNIVNYHSKKYKFVKVATIHHFDLPSDVMDDLQGRDAIEENTYPVSALKTRGKGINETTRLRMDNLRKQLKGFDYLRIVK